MLIKEVWPIRSTLSFEIVFNEKNVIEGKDGDVLFWKVSPVQDANKVL